MIASRCAPIVASSASRTPRESGPRCSMTAHMRSTASRPGRAPKWTFPAIPHMGLSGARAVECVLDLGGKAFLERDARRIAQVAGCFGDVARRVASVAAGGVLVLPRDRGVQHAAEDVEDLEHCHARATGHVVDLADAAGATGGDRGVDDVAHVGEVARLAAVAEDPDGLARGGRADESVEPHVRALARPVDAE